MSAPHGAAKHHASTVRKESSAPKEEHVLEITGTLSLREALDGEATDVHLFPSPDLKRNDPPLAFAAARVRIGGILGPLMKVEPDVNDELFGLLSNPPKPDFSASLPSGRRLRIAIRTTCSLGSGEIFIRILPETIPPVFRRLAHLLPELDSLNPGLFLVSGITGSGKSTFLASVAMRHLELGAHVVTIEDPVEYLIRSPDSSGYASQREVGIDVPDFASGVKMSMREDPDTIIVGEIRDAETAVATLTAAETGHTVLATVHAGGCYGTVDRFLSLLGGKEFEAMRLASTYVCGIHVTADSVEIEKNMECERTYEIFRSNDAARTHIRERAAHRLWQARLGTSEKDWKLTLRD